ncbi:unnamed protein product [Lymnaea stagnalis]|uniref:Cyclin-dependent kinase 2-interacting protein n=1 Tax=Lymnaea stagnalis TaxID=6523 RepID=A0AAV2GXK6_LYMST
MTSQEEQNGSGVLALVASPIPQVRQHAAGNLTGELRKVKDLAADFHNLLSKWNTLNVQGMDVITKIANIKIEQVFNKEMLTTDPTGTKLPMELNPLCNMLLDILDAMSKIILKLEFKAKTAQSLVSLQQFQKSGAGNPVLFLTMTLPDVANTLLEIHKSFSKEFNFKTELVKQVAHADNRDTMMFYSACWLHQPYVEAQCQDLLQALLKETGHIQ